jgi:Xaa-Pro aminopeptidase
MPENRQETTNGAISAHYERLKALREELARRELDGFVVPLTDEHMSEYVGSYAQRLAWLTGFRGSAGSAVVLATKAGIFVDGRYALQVRQQVDERHWVYLSIPQMSVATWLGEHTSEGARIGYDPWLCTKSQVQSLREALAQAGARLVPVSSNPVDAVWLDQPAPSDAKLTIHPNEVAGKSSAEKRQQIAQWLTATHADTVVLSALDSVAWTFNVRGQDVDHTPVARAYALIHADATADLFVALEKMTDSVIAHLGSAVRLHPHRAFAKHLGTFANKKIVIDSERAVAGIFEALELAGAKVIEARDPVVLPKAIKNDVEIAGHKAAQARDGAALCNFLHWLSTEASDGTATELSAAARLREFREATGHLRDLSFETISAFGPNSAIVHYSPTEKTNRRIEPGSLYLIDSGGQYLDGTTDVTRTVAVGEPSAEMRDRFTRVLKGHIALNRAAFPVGTRGCQLDTLARQYLWAAALNYGHGTGHGVGSYLCVHEGPQRIFNLALYGGVADEPLVAGMILSNEPGYYKTGEYGIRIENLVLVVEREIIGAEHQMLGFEVLTFAPIDRALIDTSMLTAEERTWIDAYHADVARIVGPQLKHAAKAWLLEATRPIHLSHAWTE